MNSVDYARIGKELKRLHPEETEWAENTDEEVGELGVKYGLWPPKLPKNVAPEPSSVFTGHTVTRRQNQVRETELNFQLETQLRNYQVNLAIEDLAATDRLEHMPTRLAEGEIKAEAAHELAIASADAGITQAKLSRKQIIRADHVTDTITKLALASEMTPEAYNQLRLEGEQQRLRVKEKRQMTIIGLREERAKLGMQIKAALTYSAINNHQALYLQNLLLKQVETAHSIETGNLPEAVKQKQMEIVNDVTRGMMGQLRGLLQEHTQEDDRRGVSDTDGGGEPKPTG